MANGIDAECAAVQLSPAQSNEIILDKCGLLLPRMQDLLSAFVQLKDDLENGIIHWDDIVQRSKNRC